MLFYILRIGGVIAMGAALFALRNIYLKMIVNTTEREHRTMFYFALVVAALIVTTTVFLIFGL